MATPDEPASPARPAFGRNAASMLALQLVTRLAGFVSLAVLTRTLPDHEVGGFVYAVSVSEAFNILASLNLGPVVLRRLAADRRRAPAHLGSYLGLRLATVLPYLACVVGVASLSTDLAPGFVLLVAVFVVLQQLFQPLANALMALDRPVVALVLGAAVQVAFAIALVAGMSAYPSLAVAVGAHLLRGIGLVGAVALALRRIAPPLRIGWDPRLLREARAFVAISVLDLLRRRSDVLLLALFAPLPAVGAYELASRVVGTALIVPLTFGWGIAPQVARRGGTPENRRAFVRGLVLLLGYGAAGAAVLALAAGPVARLLFGPMAGPVSALLRLFAPLLPLLVIQPYLHQVMNALHLERQVLAVLAVASATVLTLYFLWIPGLGARGVVFARLVATTVQVVSVGALLGRALRSPVPGGTA